MIEAMNCSSRTPETSSTVQKASPAASGERRRNFPNTEFTRS